MPSERKKDRRNREAGSKTQASGSAARPASGSTVRPASRVNPQVRRALHGEAVRHEPLLAFGRTNYLLLAGGVLAAALGFLLLARGDVSVAPVLIVLGYCGLIPLGIEWTRRARGGSGAEEKGE